MVKENIFISFVKRPIFFSFSKEVSGNEVRFMDDLNMSDDSNNNNSSQFRFGRKESVKSNNNSSNNNNNTTSPNSTSNAQTKPKM